MRWYEGDIAQAVATSKTKNAIFVVYVEGKDDKSTSLTSLINEQEISSQLETDNFVAIKVEAGSISHNQFAAIYKTVPVPSLFFIGKNGKPIDIIQDASAASELASRINSVIETHTGVSTASSSQSAAAKHSNDLIKNEQQSSSAVPEKPENVRENGVCYEIGEPTEKKEHDEPSSSKASEDATQFLEKEKTELSKDEKIQRAKELVEQKRETKKVEEEEATRQKELERRKMGQDVQKLRRWQQDQELKNLMEERQRAKNEEKVARERILAQIAQDKADRALRFGTSPPAPTLTPPSTASTSSPSPAPPASKSSNVARLQFRLPDGTSNTRDFDSSASLQEVRDYVSQNLNLPFRGFTLSTTFPRREFTAEDNAESLRDLELCPNAVILVLPAHSAGTVASNEGGGVLSLFWLLVSPIFSVFNYFRNLVFGQPQDEPPQPPERNKRATENAEPFPGPPSAKRRVAETTVIRRQGNSNIHRLSDRTDSDDDNNTWNGNSTQQM